MIDLIKNQFSLGYKIIFNRKQLQIYKQLIKRDVFDYDLNLQHQKNKLDILLKNAFKNIDYYKSLDLHDLDFSIYENFQKIPCMTKEIIRNNSNHLVQINYPNPKNVFRNTSGGSTGEPVSFFQTTLQAHHGMANYWYCLKLNKININSKSCNLWGAQKDMHEDKASFNLKSNLKNIITLNTFVLSDEIIEKYIDILNRTKPPFIKAYVHSIFEIAKYINSNNILIHFTPTIHCTTGPLYPEMKKEIEKAFNNAYVYNFYGSREVSAIASEIFGQDGLFVLSDNVLVEILNENDEPVKKGQEGNVVVTTLNNDYMPLIRYKIGDRAIKGDDMVFGTLKLVNVIGRTLGVIHKRDKSRIDGQFFTTLFFNRTGIKNFQIIQKSLDKLVIKIVKSTYFESSELHQILNLIKLELPDVDLDVQFTDKIELTATGKIMYVYSELSE